MDKNVVNERNDRVIKQSVNDDTHTIYGKSFADVYLDYFNNFLTLERFCEYYEVNESKGNEIIALGKIDHENRVSGLKKGQFSIEIKITEACNQEIELAIGEIRTRIAGGVYVENKWNDSCLKAKDGYAVAKFKVVDHASDM